MVFGGDPEQIRRLAAEVRRLADTAAHDRSVAAKQVAAVAWTSSASVIFQREVEADLAHYVVVESTIEAAASDLDALAQTLESRQQHLVDLANATGHTVAEIWSEAVSTGEDVMALASGLVEGPRRVLENATDAASKVAGGLL